MDRADYKAALDRIFPAYQLSALGKLREIKKTISPKVRHVMIGIHPDQDGEGYFDVKVHLDGPDLFVLNKEIAEHRTLFEVRVLEGRLVPDVPLFDPDESSFPVADAIVDIAMEWVEGLWRELGGMGVPAFAFGAEGYGTVERKNLRP